MTLYRWIVAPLAILLTGLFYLFGHKKIRAGLNMRKTQNGKSPWSGISKNERPIWLHCSSGEFEYAKSVLRQLKTSFPEIPIYVTYFSPTYRKAIEKTPEVDRSGPLPWDLPGPISQFIKNHQPLCLLIARTDLWPEVLSQCKRFEVPTLLFSATLQKRPKFFDKLVKSWLFPLLTNIFCVAPEDQENIQSLWSHPKAMVSGDTRYDQALFRIQNSQPVKANLFEQKSILIAGSTWKQDEIALIPGTEISLKNGELHMIIAPHEPTEEHLHQLEQRIHADGLHSLRYSHAEQWRDEEILIIDRVGLLADLYPFAQIAFIGGSFKGSVHSVMEALVTGCPTFVGPCHSNNREAIEFQKVNLGSSQFSAVTATHSGPELREKIEQIVLEKNNWPQWRNQIRQEVEKKLGASEKVVQWVETTLSLTPR